MRITTGVKAAIVAASAGLLLTACATDSDVDAAASASATAAAESTPNVAGIAENINTATGCEAFGGTWSGGKVAGAGVVAGWEFTCDVDGDGVVETTLSIYNTSADVESDLAAKEALAADAAIVKGQFSIVTTTDASHLESVAGTDAEVVRELPAAE